MLRFRGTMLLGAVFGLPALACSLALDTRLAGGIGTPCATEADCHGPGAMCSQNLCTKACVSDPECPAPARCESGLCRVSPNVSTDGGDGSANDAAPGTKQLGDSCKANTECASALCNDELCTKTCADTPDCPGNFVCDATFCRRTLKAGFLYDGTVSNATEGFALSHEVGRAYATAQRKWLTTDRREQVAQDAAPAKMDELIAEGSQVLVVTTGRYANQSKEKAAANPNVRVLQYASGTPATNMAIYSGRYHQAWYLAGFTAARYADTLTGAKGIAIVAPVSNSQVNRQINAFTLGVRKVNPTAKVEVLWLNNFVPSTAIINAAVDALIAAGNRVIVNRLGNGQVVRQVATKNAVNPRPVSIGIDNQNACEAGSTSCLGAPYWNWGPLYVRLFDNIHKNRPDENASINDPIKFDPAQSTFHFALNTVGVPALAPLQTDISNLIGTMTGPGGEDYSLKGPYTTSVAGSRAAGDTIAADQYIQDAELNNMCWLVDGVVHRPTGTPNYEDGTAVAAHVPDGQVLWPPQTIDPANTTGKPTCVP